VGGREQVPWLSRERRRDHEPGVHGVSADCDQRVPGESPGAGGVERRRCVGEGGVAV
jgi:hypothetical protein